MSAHARVVRINQEGPSFADVLREVSIPEDHADQFSHITLPFRLMPHQIENLHCGLSWERFGLFDDMRTGKTIVLQLLAIFYRQYGLRTVMIMPPVLFDQFKESFSEIQGHGLTVKALSGDSNRKIDAMQTWAIDKEQAPDILLITKEMFSGPHGKKNKARTKYVEYLRPVFQCLTWDECHMGLQSEGTAVFAAVERFMGRPEARLVLSTGTPTTNELKNAYPIIRLKNPDAYKSRRHFDFEHVVFRKIFVKIPPTIRSPNGVKEVSTVDHYIQTEKLSEKLYWHAHRVTRHDVLDIDQPNIQIVPIRLNTGHLRFYRTTVKNRLIEMETEDGTEMVDLRKDQALRQFALRIVTAPEFGGWKGTDNQVISGVQSLLDSCGISDNKVVLFANFNNSVDYLVEKFSAYKPAKIYGLNSGDKNRSEAARFKTDQDCRIAVINPQAGGVGLTLGDVSRTAIFVEPVSTPGLFEQASARILLKGQTEPASVYILKVLDTISPKAIEHMLKKGEEIQEVIKDKKALLEELFPETDH